MKINKIILLIFSICIIIIGSFFYGYNSLIDQSKELIDNGEFSEAYKKLNFAESISFSENGKINIKILRNNIEQQEKCDDIFEDLKIKYKNRDLIYVLKNINSIGEEYYRYDELKNIKIKIESELDEKVKMFILSLEDNEVLKSVELYKEVAKYQEYISLDKYKIEIDEFKIKTVNEYIKKSKMLIKSKNYYDAKINLEIIKDYEVKKDEISKLLKICTEEIEVIEERKANKVAEEEKKKKLNSIRENMKEYSNTYGNIEIAVTNVKKTNSVSDSYTTYSKTGDGKFVWLKIYAKNFGSEVEHVNPNYFTITTENGNTVNPDNISYNFEYFDAINLNSNNSTSGWLIFYTTNADIYTLNFNGIKSEAHKKIVD